MNRRFYWGIATLIILLIGVSVFLLTRTPETEPEIIYNPFTPEEKAEVAHNIQEAIDNTKKDLSPIAEDEHQEAPHKNSQQSGSAESVTIESHEVSNKNAQDTDILSPEEVKALYRMLDTEGLKPDKISKKQALYLNKVGLSWHYLSPKQEKEVLRDFHARYGLNPPPEGYKYKFDAPGEIALDENGDAIIYKIDDRSIKKSFGFNTCHLKNLLVQNNTEVLDNLIMTSIGAI